MAFNSKETPTKFYKKKNRRPIFCGIAIHRLCNSVADPKHSKNLVNFNHWPLGTKLQSSTIHRTFSHVFQFFVLLMFHVIAHKQNILYGALSSNKRRPQISTASVTLLIDVQARQRSMLKITVAL